MLEISITGRLRCAGRVVTHARHLDQATTRDLRVAQQLLEQQLASKTLTVAGRMFRRAALDCVEAALAGRTRTVGHLTVMDGGVS